MDNRFIYICGCPHTADNAIKSIKKNLARQTRFNKNVVIFVAAMVAYAVVADINNRELNHKIEKLNSELNELKRSKGE